MATQNAVIYFLSNDNIKLRFLKFPWLITHCFDMLQLFFLFLFCLRKIFITLKFVVLHQYFQSLLLKCEYEVLPWASGNLLFLVSPSNFKKMFQCFTYVNSYFFKNIILIIQTSNILITFSRPRFNRKKLNVNFLHHKFPILIYFSQEINEHLKKK